MERAELCDRHHFQEQHPRTVIVNKGRPAAEQLDLDHTKSPWSGGGAKPTSAASPFVCGAAAAVRLWIDRATLDSLSCDASPYRLSEETEKLPACDNGVSIGVTVSARVPVAVRSKSQPFATTSLLHHKEEEKTSASQRGRVKPDRKFSEACGRGFWT